MPSIASTHSVKVYRHPSAFPQQVWDALSQNEQAANVMLPHATKAKVAGANDSQLWMTCSTFRSARDDPDLDLILSCTEGPLGSYPVFIIPTAPFHDLHDEYLYPRLELLISRILLEIPQERIFSVFAPEPISIAFTKLWSCRTGVGYYEEPYYAAQLTYCTSETFVDRRATMFPDVVYVPRKATEEDVASVAPLCQGFAETSAPFLLNDKRARKEAKYLIRSGFLWVLEATRPGEAPELASIVAVTRQSATVAGITKVFTNPRWRKRGCAERLVRAVCKELLRSKQSIVLYCAHNNAAAAGVYHRVGFVGLDDCKAACRRG
ncbi:hypothetical protein EVG20_g9390 [Dentipellis fragilis]|uniref:N-acetyltransferase domain-containing protein n=1 Tax=Dentipellis fragilis TaxID=205917 RepID=A0A4Y9XZZ1_9AGAM|nr:hypothetical protein EVG20_g9390 [Dentipellis fragilis]